MKDFALLSHVLPPSPSGQGIILYRLLQDIDPASYYLLSNKNYDMLDQQTLASHKLETMYYSLTQEPAKYTRSQHKIPAQSMFKLWLKSTPLYALVIWIRVQQQQVKKIVKLIFQTRTRSHQIAKILEHDPVEVLIACTGDVNNIPAAFLACRKTNTKFIPYIFDDYVYQWKGIVRLIMKIIAVFVFKRANEIIVTNGVMATEYKHRYGVDSIVIHNLCPIPHIDATTSPFTNKTDTINIVYAGATYAHTDALKNLVEAIKQLGDNRLALHIYTMTAQDLLERQGIYGSFVSIHPYIPQAMVFEVLSQADVLFLPLAFNSPIPEIINTASPGKMGEYMALSRPILVHAPADSFISNYFRKNKCGVVVDEPRIDVLADGLSTLLNNKALRIQISQQARKQAIQDFAIETVQNNFIKTIGEFGLRPTK
jgi:glycosyltransferase involved in cell wall biosynthesis